MGPLFAVAIMLAMFQIGMASIIPASVVRNAANVASQNAANYTIYQNALNAWWANNHGFSGTVPANSLTFPTGVSSIAGWTNLISGGVLYIYSTGNPNPSGRTALLNNNVDATSVGVVSSASVGTLMTGATMVIPAAIPIGATFTWNM